MLKERARGILLHLTSLPSPYGIGDLGPEAYNFMDFLTRTQQKLWQILPLNPPDHEGSPYKSLSAFADNPLLISADKLIESGLLKAEEVDDVPKFTETKVQFFEVTQFKKDLFLKAFRRFAESRENGRYEQYKEENKDWLADFCLYMALREHFSYKPWNYWDKDIAFRDEEALKRYRNKLAEEVRYQEFLQYLFSQQWQEVRNYANHRGLKIIGDLPIFVAHNSSDVWAHPELFDLDERGNPRKVVGVPPDYFSKTGQLWGNPPYNWKRMQEDNFLWWRRRFEKLLKQVDIIKLDHFRGFEAYWEVDAAEKTAIKGKWIKVPGYELFSTLKQYWGELPLIVEDLGLITPEVQKLKKSLGFPGMKVFQFSFDPQACRRSPLGDDEEDCVFYTGTHDNDTLLGWYRGLKQSKDTKVLRKLERYYGIKSNISEEQVCWAFIKAVYSSRAKWVIIPLQDILCLGSEARMNLPGTVGGNNWLWRFKKGDLTAEIEKKLTLLVQKYAR